MLKNKKLLLCKLTVVAGLAAVVFTSLACSQKPAEIGEAVKVASSNVQDGNAELVNKADSGDVNAMLALAKKYDQGNNVKQDLKTALRWFEAAADKGNGVAAYEVALRYGRGYGAVTSESKFQIFLDRAIELNHPVALVLGSQVKYGLRIYQEFEKIFLTITASEPGNKDATHAIDLLNRAAGRGNAHAIFLLAMIDYGGVVQEGGRQILIVKPKSSERSAALKIAADAGNWRAALKLATLTGPDSAKITQEMRVKYWQTINSLSDAHELASLAALYFPEFPGQKKRMHVWEGNIQTEKQAYELATRFLKRAAEAQTVDAVYAYGAHLAMDSNGFKLRGFSEYAGDWILRQEGLTQLKKATDMGSIPAKVDLASAFETGILSSKDFAEALRLRLEVLNSGDHGRIKWVGPDLAMMYLNGKGTVKDEVQAYAWFNIGRREGLNAPDTAATFAALEAKLSSDQLMKGQEMARNWQPGSGPLSSVFMSFDPQRVNSPAVVANGSAVRIHSDGILLTNHHVIAGCTEVRRAGTDGKLRLLAGDANNDLAVLGGDLGSANVISIYEGQAKLGEDVSTYGFPLTGFLASSGNFTRGQISALSGVNNNSSYLRFTAPIQPGNSGGPLLNDYGQLIGLVSAKADALAIAKITKDISQNLNFAVNALTIQNFLTTNKIEHLTSKNSWYSRKSGVTEIAEAASNVAVKIECLK